MIIFLSLFLVFSAFAQQFEYRMDGSFQVEITPETLSGQGSILTPTTVNYTIHWNETPTTIIGIYQDNIFTSNNPTMLTGTVGADGRQFNVPLSDPVFGVSQLSFTTSLTGITSGTVSIRTEVKSPTGAEVDEFSGFALMSSTPGEDEGGIVNDNDSCTVGFGSLTKLCGVYNGNFHEISDTNNRCDIESRNPRLEFSPDTMFRILLDYTPGVSNLPTQVIGAFLPSPTSQTVNVTRRECANIPGTSFIPGTCKTYNLMGSFNTLANMVQFSGTYVITDDFSADSCSYTMNLNREIDY